MTNNLVTISADLQSAIFSKLSAEIELAALFADFSKASPALPRLDFDELQTRPHPEGNADLYVHAFSFSVWSDLHESRAGLEKAEKVRDIFHEAQLTLQHSTLISLKFDALISAKNTRARYHRHQIFFTALTDNASS